MQHTQFDKLIWTCNIIKNSTKIIKNYKNFSLNIKNFNINITAHKKILKFFNNKNKKQYNHKFKKKN